MNYLSLFTGIGGLDLGLDRAGMTCVGQVERDPYCLKVLAKHWPAVPRHDDVRTAVDWWRNTPCDLCGGLGYVGGITGDCYCRRSLRPYAGTAMRSFGDGKILRKRVDVICGGFPCQDISNAGRRVGIRGERSGLWSYMADTVRVLRPRYVLMENVSAILVRGLDVVAGDLAEIGYDVQWDCIPAAAVGAPHRRDRWWAVAYPDCDRVRLESVGELGCRSANVVAADGANGVVADPAGERCGQGRPGRPDSSGADGKALGTEALADALSVGRQPWSRQHSPASIWSEGDGQPGRSSWWAVEPDVGRVAHGIPNRVDRLRALGNAVVPQVAEHVGRLIVDYDEQVAA